MSRTARRAVALTAAVLLLASGPATFVRLDGALLPLTATAIALLAAALGYRSALPYAVAAGLVMDVFSGRAFGLHVLGYLFLAGLEGWLSRRVYTEAPVLLVGAIAFGVFVERLLTGGFLAALHAGAGDVLGSAVVGALLAVPLALLYRRVLGPMPREKLPTWRR